MKFKHFNLFSQASDRTGKKLLIIFFEYWKNQTMHQDKAAILDQLELIFQDTFVESNLAFSMDTNRDDVAEWDSLSHIRLLTAIEASFGVQFDLEEIVNMTSVAAIVNLLYEKLN